MGTFSGLMPESCSFESSSSPEITIVATSAGVDDNSEGGSNLAAAVPSSSSSDDHAAMFLSLGLNKTIGWRVALLGPNQPQVQDFRELNGERGILCLRVFWMPGGGTAARQACRFPSATVPG
ncbi:hypothetical protein VTI28DRAFT_6877 [Corynascus sepedonium]